MDSLAQLGWRRETQHLCSTVPTGCGETWLACAPGNQASRQGALLCASLTATAPTRACCPSFCARNSFYSTIGGMQKVSAQQRQDLMEIIEDRHDRWSTLIASQFSIDHWHEYIGEAMLADAILGRLLHGSHRIALSGGIHATYRQRRLGRT